MVDANQETLNGTTVNLRMNKEWILNSGSQSLAMNVSGCQCMTVDIYEWQWVSLNDNGCQWMAVYVNVNLLKGI